MNQLNILKNLKTLSFASLIALTSATEIQASVSVWSSDIKFREFEGLAGGFEDDTTPVILQSRTQSGPTTRNYDVLAPTGTSSVNGGTVYGSGQDGSTDLSITTRVMDSTGGRWYQADAVKRRNAYMGDITVDSGTSRSGDHAIMAFEFSVADHLNITGEDFGIRVSSANGLGEVYEWTFVTLGGVDDSPFSLESLADYNHLVYNDLNGSSYFNLDGTVKAGGVATTNQLAAGKTISQFLTGEPAGSPRGNLVDQGWYALDQRNVLVEDGVETAFTSPGSGTAAILDKTITGADLGMLPTDQVKKFTVWFGYYDVGIDTNGDGFTMANSNQDAWITQLSLGQSIPSTIPEPSSSVLALAGCLLLLRRKRR